MMFDSLGTSDLTTGRVWQRAVVWNPSFSEPAQFAQGSERFAAPSPDFMFPFDAFDLVVQRNDEPQSSVGAPLSNGAVWLAFPSFGLLFGRNDKWLGQLNRARGR
jgi:hypothetical protein